MIFEWDEWVSALQHFLRDSKTGIAAAADHRERLMAYHVYTQRLAVLLKKIPEISDLIDPLYDLRDELDLLIHRHSSDLLRPAEAPRSMVTYADKRLRMIAVACVMLFRKVGLDDVRSREHVAKIILAHNYHGGKRKFNKSELTNWMAKIANEELPGAEFIADLHKNFPTIQSARTFKDACDLSKEMIGRIRLPPISGAQAKRDRAQS